MPIGKINGMNVSEGTIRGKFLVTYLLTRLQYTKKAGVCSLCHWILMYEIHKVCAVQLTTTHSLAHTFVPFSNI